MTLKDIAKQLTTAVQTVPNLVQILRDGLEQATAGSSVEVTQVVSSGTKIASIKVDDDTTDLYAPASSDYSTTETIVGKWIDGKSIYRKTIPIAALPDTAFQDTAYPHGISNLDKIIKYNITVYTADNRAVNTDHVNIASGTLSNSSWISSLIDSTNIYLTTGTDRSTWSAVAIIEYTKTA